MRTLSIKQVSKLVPGDLIMLADERGASIAKVEEIHDTGHGNGFREFLVEFSTGRSGFVSMSDDETVVVGGTWVE